MDCREENLISRLVSLALTQTTSLGKQHKVVHIHFLNDLSELGTFVLDTGTIITIARSRNPQWNEFYRESGLDLFILYIPTFFVLSLGIGWTQKNLGFCLFFALHGISNKDEQKIKIK